jgi:hypothetical protein
METRRDWHRFRSPTPAGLHSIGVRAERLDHGLSLYGTRRCLKAGVEGPLMETCKTSARGPPARIAVR